MPAGQSAELRYDALPVFSDFEQVSRPEIYAPLPDDWQVGVTDVVRSTEAIGKGRYKAVNMAGAASVGAVMNAVDQARFPFVFGGDGAILAVPPDLAGKTADALAATVRFVAEELDLTLRAGMMPVSAIRNAGHDVRIARYAASEQAIYAMFSGGGGAYAEAELKADRLSLPPAPPGTRPDLAGLSCRWAPIRARNGFILSIVVRPAAGADPEAFRRVAETVIGVVAGIGRGGHPVPEEGPNFAIRPSALSMETRATRTAGESRLVKGLKIVGQMLFAIALDETNRSAGRFDPKRYRRWVERNTDFRKYDDGLLMTIDSAPETAETIETLLQTAEAERIVDYGLHRQDEALMTCIVPSPLTDDHIHFLDGGGGGYAMSAAALKARLAARQAAPGRAA